MSRAELGARARRRVVAAFARYRLRSCSRVGCSPRVHGTVWIHGDGAVVIGDRVYLDARTAPIELYAWAGASIVIGDDAYIGGGTSIEATGSILVGARAHLGAFCKVMDNHFHPLVGNRNTRPLPRPVVLGADVRVGPRAIVMAGARIAQGTKVEAGAVVKRATRAGAGAANG